MCFIEWHYENWPISHYFFLTLFDSLTAVNLLTTKQSWFTFQYDFLSIFNILTLWAKWFSCTEIETRSWTRHWMFKFKVWKALRKLKKPPPPFLSILLKQTSKNIYRNHRYDILQSKLHHMKQRSNPGKIDQRQLYISTKCRFIF